MKMPDDEEPKQDGRRARGERARSAVADALLALFAEGDLAPPAPRIAERAGVSLRLLYHHFEDLEALWDEVGRRQVEKMLAHIHPISKNLPLEERIRALVEQRAKIYEIITPTRRAALLHEPTSAKISTRLSAVRAGKRAQVVAIFSPELDSLREPEQRLVKEALCAAASWNTWESMRAPLHQGLSVEMASQVMIRMLSGILSKQY